MPTGRAPPTGAPARGGRLEVGERGAAAAEGERSEDEDDRVLALEAVAVVPRHRRPGEGEGEKRRRAAGKERRAVGGADLEVTEVAHGGEEARVDHRRPLAGGAVPPEPEGERDDGDEREEPPRAEEDEPHDPGGHARLHATAMPRTSASAAGHIHSGRSSTRGGRPEGFGSRRSSSLAIASRSVMSRTRQVSPPLVSAMARSVAMSTASRDAGRSSRILGPEGDGVDADAILGGEARDVGRIEPGGGVAPVGKQHDDPRARRPGEDALQREAEAVGDRRGAPGDADVGALDGAGDGGEVEGQRRGDVGAVGEDDDADAVAAAGLDEARRDALDGSETRGGLAVEREVLDRHAPRQVEGEDDVPARRGAVGNLDEPLRPGDGGDEAEPEGDEERPGPVEPLRRRRAGARRDRRRQVERLPAGAARRQEAGEEGQGEQQESERKGEADHRRPRPRNRSSIRSGSGGVRP